MRLLLCLVLLVAHLLPPHPARARDVEASQRHALVIGIGAYARARDLANPSRDAQAIAAALAALGFTLWGAGPLIDPDRAELLGAFAEFSAGLPEGAVAAVYLAGHGVTQDGQSYILPADDAGLATRADLPVHGVPLRALTGRLAARPAVTSILFIDACSANPLRGSAPEGDGGAGAAADLVAGDGAMALIYAAAPGQIAADGQGTNSPFAAALLGALQMPQAPVDALLAHIAQRMRAEGGQTPWMMISHGRVARAGPLHLIAPTAP